MDNALLNSKRRKKPPSVYYLRLKNGTKYDRTSFPTEIFRKVSLCCRSASLISFICRLLLLLLLLFLLFDLSLAGVNDVRAAP